MDDDLARLVTGAGAGEDDLLETELILVSGLLGDGDLTSPQVSVGSRAVQSHLLHTAGVPPGDTTHTFHIGAETARNGEDELLQEKRNADVMHVTGKPG